MKHFCSQYSRIDQYKDAVLRHLIVDDAHKVIYCYVPKTGCTTMKTAFLLLQKLFTFKQLENVANVTHKDYLSKVLSLCSNRTDTVICDTPSSLIKHKLKTYYKFMIVRNPLERLYSAYSEKLSAISTSTDVYRLMQKLILQYSDDNQSKFPNFTQFISTFVGTDQLNDHHFLPMVEICDPCSIKYDLYVDFSNMDRDIDSLFLLLGIPRRYYFNKVRHTPTLMPHQHSYNNSTVVTKSYEQLEPNIKDQFFKRYSVELDFFRTVYPDQIN